MKLRFFVRCFLLLAVMWSADTLAGSPDSQSSSLISVKQFQALRDSDASWLAIDVRSKVYFSLGHISGAFNLWRPDYEAEDGEYPFYGMRASPEKMERLLGRLGVTPDTLLVLYDEHNNLDSSRLWWILRLYGHQRVVLLDGGFSAWKEAGHAAVMGYSSPSVTKISHYRFDKRQSRPEWLAELADVHELLKDKRNILLDVRTLAEATGKQKKSGAFRKGRIPGSLWFQYDQVVSDDGFHSKQELQKLFSKAGVTPDTRIIVYCQSGVRSANTLFVLKELLNYPNVKNFDGSWVEWSYHKDLSAETGTLSRN